MSNEDAVTAITQVVRTYMEAMTSGNRTALERVFFEGASEVGHFEGELLWNSRETFIAMCEDAADPKAIPVWEIRALSIQGDIAVVHVEDDWAGMRFDDFLSLLCHEGHWRIVSKIYRIQP